MNKKSSATIGGRELSLSNLDKIYWPRDGYTKGELIHYYAEIASYLLPYLHERPLVFTRYPDGIDGNSFYQKNAPEYLPDWIPTYHWQSQDKTSNNLILAEETAALAWLANQAHLEIHPWLSRQNSILYPDFIVFDLDPYEGCPFQVVVEIARLLKQLLDDMGLRTYLKTSGASGLHIFLPIINKYDYAQGRNWAGKLAGLVCQAMPDKATIERSVKDRGNRVYVDYMQNVVGKTLCSPYSVRPRDGAPVSTPLRWEELPDISPRDFNIKTIFTRVERLGDLFSPVLTDKQNIDEAMSILH
ncbi:MAG: non-homologous end-joining DNA ligase [Syntrophomonas sp.]